MTKLEVFNATIAALFTQLHDAFPAKTTFNKSQIQDILGESPDPTTVSQSISWLRDEGFIRDQGFVEVGGGGEARHLIEPAYVLAHKGLVALNRVPNSLEAPIADQLKELVKDGAKEAGKSAIGSTIGEILGGALKGMMS